MTTNTHDKVRKMDWDELEKSLTASPGTRGVPTQERELRDYFGDEEFDYLRRLGPYSRSN